ncbi:zinc finger protein 69 homolog [Sarcophilus harrisii]
MISRTLTARSQILTFQDVTVDFTREEWKLLGPAQKDLFRRVMLENYENFAFLAELSAFKPSIISELERTETLWMQEEETIFSFEGA